ncbi:hypothetical protein [Streptomyces sp. SAI-127]|uniref:hypothetical protein n=1 Tax=Streptomyces sp. SAI-127 TaxID=2940543 RepID=UPI002475551A|nr:hypothetical protein [Streptomyces sp. SAI-127]MDH6489572.1 hypothetical protein [Streptomyces sp. SAI-127]
MTAWTRRHCVCTEVRNLDYEEAANALKIKTDWLRDNISKLPHQKFGQNPAVFCHCDLRLIQAMNTAMPAKAQEVLNAPADQAAPTPAETPTALPYQAARPAKRARRAVAQV